MAHCAGGVTSAGSDVSVNPRHSWPARTPLSSSLSDRISSLELPRASLTRAAGLLRLRTRGEPALLLSPIASTLRRRYHESFFQLLVKSSPEEKNGSRSSSISPVLGSNRSSIISRASSMGDSACVEKEEKPQWWWRTAACLPYFLPLHETWNYGETAVYLQPHLQRFEFLTNPVLGVPPWFSILYFFVSYFWLVRRKELPHFLRFHIMAGLLLENALQIIWTVSRWTPLSILGLKLGMYLWTAVSFTFIFCVLRCVGCALAGRYADIPHISDSAFAQIPHC